MRCLDLKYRPSSLDCQPSCAFTPNSCLYMVSSPCRYLLLGRACAAVVHMASLCGYSTGLDSRYGMPACRLPACLLAPVSSFSSSSTFQPTFQVLSTHIH